MSGNSGHNRVVATYSKSRLARDDVATQIAPCAILHCRHRRIDKVQLSKAPTPSFRAPNCSKPGRENNLGFLEIEYVSVTYFHALVEMHRTASQALHLALTRLGTVIMQW